VKSKRSKKGAIKNPETLATLSTQTTERRKQNTQHNTTQHRKLKRWATLAKQNFRGQPMCLRRVRIKVWRYQRGNQKS